MTELRMEYESLVNRWLSKSQELAVHHNELNEAKQQLVGEKAKLEMLLQTGGGGMGNVDMSDIDPEFMTGSAAYVTVPNTMKHKWDCHQGSCCSVAFNNSTGTTFASAGADKTVKLWQSLSGDEVTTLSGARASCLVANFSPDDSLILSGDAGAAIRVFGASTHRSKFTLTGHKEKVVQVMATADSRTLFSASHDRTVKVWDLNRGANTNTILTRSYINDMGVSNDGNTLATGHHDGYLRFWDPRTEDEVAGLELHTGHITSVSFSANGEKVLTSCRDNTLKVVDARMHRELMSLRHGEYSNVSDSQRARFSPDGRFAVAGSANGSVHIWDLMTGKHHSMLKNRDGHQKPVMCVSWSPLGDALLSCDNDGVVCQWHYAAETKPMRSSAGSRDSFA